MVKKREKRARGEEREEKEPWKRGKEREKEQELKGESN